MVDYLITLITTLLRLHQSTNSKQDLLLCKNIIYPEWKHLWVSFLSSILVRKFGLTFRKNWNHLRLIFLAKNIKSPAILPSTSCWSSFYMLVTFCLIFVLYSCHILKYCADAIIFPPIYLYSCSPHPLYIGMLYPTVFCCCFYAFFTWRWFDAFSYFYYYL